MSNLFYKFSKKLDGNMSYMFDNPRKVSANRRKFLGKSGISMNECSSAFLKHTKRVVVAKHKGIEQKDYELLPKADGLVTNEKGLYLFMTFGDCLPVILYDPINSVAGLIHAGWKGTDKEIVRVAVSKMAKMYKSDSQKMQAIIGPSIRKESYVFANPIQIEKDKVSNSRWGKYVKQVKDEFYSIDLIQFNTDLLTDSGLLPQNITDMRINTAKDNRYYSHYRDSRSQSGDTGRFACVVGIK